jgi:DNA (cytosine-5)-methyltransferase 1
MLNQSGKIRILELFSGYGTATFALKRLGLKHEVIAYSDIDKYANQCFKQNHGGKELGDVRKINPLKLPDFDLLTGGFPCQAFSVAGKMGGETESRGTLFYEIIRIAEVKKPRYMLLENVKGLTCKKFKDTFDKILSELDRIGYRVYWKVLNSKDYGIPQSRARVWFVCFRKTESVENVERVQFQWPKPTELKIFIKDILEQEVDKKYYLSPLLQERFKQYLDKKLQVVNLQPRNGKGQGGKGIISKGDGTTYCVDQHCGQGIVVQKDNLVYDSHRKDEIREYEETSPTLKSTMGTGGNNVPMVLTGLQAHQSIKTDGISNALPSAMGEGGGHIPMILNPIKNYKEPNDISVCQSASSYKGYGNDGANIINQGQLRRLTPKECFRLMGFLNDEINLEGLSDTQRYKLAGNGQDVNMVSLIFKEMFNGNTMGAEQ